MFSKLSKRIRKNDGFTLIELIVVVAILGILAAVLTPKVLDALENARGKSAEASAKQIQLAFERYLIQEHHYPRENQVPDRAALIGLVDNYVNIEANQIAEVFVYDGYDDAGAPVADTVDPASYRLRVTFTSGNMVVDITPTEIVSNP